jgi:hypothetical protein
VCCVQAALHISSLYHVVKSQLQYTEQQYRNHVRHLQGQLESTQLEVERERKASEVTNQQFLELEDCHNRLQDDLKRREQSERNAIMFAEEVSRQVKDLHNGRSVSDLVLESAKNSQLVNVLSGQYTEEDTVTRLKYVMEQNVDIQRRNTELFNQAKAMSKQVEKGNSEIINLKKALELTTEDKQRKKTRRGKGKPLSIDQN